MCSEGKEIRTVFKRPKVPAATKTVSGDRGAWKARKLRERRHNMERIVIMKGSSVDSPDEYVLTECLKIMFPDCEVEIRSNLPGNNRGEEAHDRAN